MVKHFFFWDEGREYEKNLHNAMSDVKDTMEIERPVIFLRDLFRFNTYVIKQTDIHMMTILVFTSLLIAIIGLNRTAIGSSYYFIMGSIAIGLLMSLVNLYRRYLKNKIFFESWLSEEDKELEEEKIVVDDTK